MIEDNKLDTSVFDAIRTCLIDADIEINSKKVPIRASFNDKQSTKPQIILYPIDYSEAGWKYGSNQGRKTINVFLEYYGANTLEVDEIAEQCVTAIKEKDFEDIVLTSVNLNYMEPINPNEVKYRGKGNTFTFLKE